MKWLMLAMLSTATVSLPGCSREYATSSAIDFTGSDGRTTSVLVASASVETGANACCH